jgi:hypothetical protein
VKQNRYDDANFFAKYSEMPRSIVGRRRSGPYSAACSPNFLGNVCWISDADLVGSAGTYGSGEQVSSQAWIFLERCLSARGRTRMARRSNVGWARLRKRISPRASSVWRSVPLALHDLEVLGTVYRKISHWLKQGDTFVFLTTIVVQVATNRLLPRRGQRLALRARSLERKIDRTFTDWSRTMTNASVDRDHMSRQKLDSAIIKIN